jgi:hypothetical protein
MFPKFESSKGLDEFDQQTQCNEPAGHGYELQKEPDQRPPGDPQHHIGIKQGYNRLPARLTGLGEQKIGAK